MPFPLQPHGYKVAKTPKVSSNMGSRRNPRANLSSRRSVRWSKQGGACLPRSIVTLADETISSSGVHQPVATHQSRWARGWHRGFLGAHCVTKGMETERLLWHCMRRAASSAGSSGRQIQLAQVPFLEVARGCVIGWAFGGLARFLLLNGGHTSLLTADPSRQ